MRELVLLLRKLGISASRYAQGATIASSLINRQLTQYIAYKAALGGIKVIQVLEARTSQYCRKCYQKGARKIQGLFTCAKCAEENADRNAAFNIAFRALGYISKVGVTVNMPNTRTFASVDRNAMMTKEATYFNRR